MNRCCMIISVLILTSSVLFAQTGQLGGRITDSETGRPLPGVAVSVSKTGKGAYTDHSGVYMIRDLPAGTCRIEISMISYKTENRTVTIQGGETTHLDIILRPKAIDVKGVVVTPGHYGISRGSDDSDQFLTVDEIKTTTGAWGDVYMSLSSLPGVTSHGPAAPIYVQGGRSEENLVLFDKGWVANPFHMDIGGGGVYSIFTPPLLSGVNLYTAGFGAEYGDCLSAVLDVDTRDGDYYDYKGSASLSMSNAELFIEGPIPGTNNRSAFMLSGRRSYFDILIGLSEYDEDFEVFPNYYDFTAKVSTRISVKHRIALTGLLAADNAVLKPTALDSTGGIIGNTEWYSKKGVVSAGWYASPSEYLNSQMVLSASLSDIEHLLGGVWHNDETKVVFALREDVTWSRPENHRVKTGLLADWRIHEVSANMPVLSHRLEHLRIDMPSVEMDTSLAEPFLGIYVADIWQVTKKVSLAPGMRTDYFFATDEITFSPRIAAAFEAGEKVVLRGAWGLYYQTPPLLELTEGHGNPELSSRRAQHIVGGIETELIPGFTVRLEGFYKSFDRLPLKDSTGSLTNEGEGYA
ncbi:hypothetical protein GF359_05705, partial [candidate division WOR-3 bacterium]|nr:hypothetical protein [candidate division WOR-3 bacterium]MBD3364692.1 hypothetical protein [candidate division WOR-3 bacterium]